MRRFRQVSRRMICWLPVSVQISTISRPRPFFLNFGTPAYTCTSTVSDTVSRRIRTSRSSLKTRNRQFRVKMRRPVTAGLFVARSRRCSRPALDLVAAPMVTTLRQDTVDQTEKSAPRERPKPELTAKQEVKARTWLRPNVSTQVSLALPMSSLRPGLGDVSVNFGVVAPPHSASESADRIEPMEPIDPTPFTVRDLDAPPRLLVPVRPIYPLKAKQRGIEGYVDIEFEIEADGTVNTVEVVGSQPSEVFEEAACSAARRWRFSVPLKDGEAVKVLARQRIQFRLEK